MTEREQEYRQFVCKIQNHNLDLSDKELIHAIIGIASESGELLDILKKHIVYHCPLDYVQVKEEAGDLLHYLTSLLITFGWELEDLMVCNTIKLNKRYPDGYSDKAALERKDKIC